MNLSKDWMPSPESMRNIFVEWYNENVADFDVPEITEDEAYVVWFCYTVGNAKALISTLRKDHMYYEVTYRNNAGCDHASDCVFVDQYVKIKHSKIDREQG